MKKWALLFMLSLVMITPAFAGEDAYRIRVDGLSCPFCAYGIEKKLKALPGATGVEVDMEKGVVTVHVAPGAEVSEAALRQAVKDSGFTPRTITRGDGQP